LIALWLYVPLDTKQVISETFPKPSRLGVEKQKPNATKARIHQSKEMYKQPKINTKKLKPGLVVSYDIWPGNRGPILVLALDKFVNYSLT